MSSRSKEAVMVSTCPLCLGPEEVESMLTIKIDRIVPRGRAAIMLCRSCAAAVDRAIKASDETLPPAPSAEEEGGNEQ